MTVEKKGEDKVKTELIEIFEVKELTTSDWEKIVQTIEKSFKKSLQESFSQNDIIKIFYSTDFRGVAIIKNFMETVYLDKLAVLEEHRGIGLGNALLTRIFEEFTQLIWRASHHNPYVNFYYRHCDGLVKSKKWIVFWKNYSLDDIKKVIELILEKPSDFRE